MPFEIFEARIVGVNQGQEFNIVTHWQQKVENAGDALSLANYVQANFVGSLNNATSEDSLWQGVLVRQLTPEVQDPYLSEDFPDQPGGIASPSLPSFVAAIIQLRTGFASRRKRGRIYLPSIPVDKVEDGRLTAAGKGEINNAINTIMASIGSGLSDWELGVYSKTTVAETGDPYSGFSGVTAMIPNEILGTQRRRRIGSGS